AREEPLKLPQRARKRQPRVLVDVHENQRGRIHTRSPFQAIAFRASRRSPAGSGPTHRQTLPLGGVCVNRTSMVRTSIAKANARIDVATLTRINKEEHAAIYDAIKDKDAERARECMKRHIAKAMERLGISTE